MARRSLTACGLVAVGILLTGMAPTSLGQPAGDKPAEDIRAKVRELEERIARLEKQAASAALSAEETVPVAELVVNLFEPRMTRYLRCKITLQVDEKVRKEVAETVARKKAALRSGIIELLAGQTIPGVSGGQNILRLKAALKTRIEEVAFPNQKTSPIGDVLFEEFVVQ